MLTIIIVLLLAIFLAIIFPKLMRGFTIVALLFVGYVVYKMNTDVPGQSMKASTTIIYPDFSTRSDNLRFQPSQMRK